jgi:hypothetical protein
MICQHGRLRVDCYVCSKDVQTIRLEERIEQLEGELKAARESHQETLCEWRDHDSAFEKQLAEREATILKLREAAIELRNVANHFDVMSLANIANEALSTESPAEHLSQYRDAVIEECANAAESVDSMASSNPPVLCAKVIRAMKGQK